MRITVDISKSDAELMDETARNLNISRDEFIRQAIMASLMPYRRKMDHAAFGAWSNCAEDGMAYQNNMRAEW